MPSLAIIESASERVITACLAFASDTLGRSVDLDLPVVFRSGIEFGNSCRYVIVLPFEVFKMICGGIV